LQTARTQRHYTYKPVPTKKYTILIFQARKENTKKKGGGKKNNNSNNKGDCTIPCKFYTSCEVHDVLSGSVSSSLKKPKKKREREKENNDDNNNNNHFAAAGWQQNH
jgi:hypothetical protein